MPGHATSAQAAASPQSYISSSCQRNQRALSPRAGVQMGGSAGSRHPLGFQIRYVNFADRIGRLSGGFLQFRCSREPTQKQSDPGKTVALST